MISDSEFSYIAKDSQFGIENKTKANVTLLSGRLGAALHQAPKQEERR